jgi:L-ascorbate oxidase
MTISNQNDSPLSIHLHGLLQKGSPASDGASYISSSPLAPWETRSLTTKIGANEAGTFFYHAHYELEDMHVYGPLIVNHPAERAALPPYDEDRVVVLSDYWPDKIEDLAYGLVQAPVFQFPRPAVSFLTNGVGACFPPNVTKYHITPVTAGKRYRVRIIAAGVLYAVHWHVRGHLLELVEADGNLIQPLTVDGIEIFSGQRYSAILTANQKVDDYWIEQHARWRDGVC